MNDYAPTTDNVRAAYDYALRTGNLFPSQVDNDAEFDAWIASEHRKYAINILDTAANALAELPPHAILEPGLRVAVETLRTMSREIASRDTP